MLFDLCSQQIVLMRSQLELTWAWCWVIP